MFQNTTSTYSKFESSYVIKKQLHCDNKLIPDKTKDVTYMTEISSLEKHTAKSPEPSIEKTQQLPFRRQTYLVGEKENLPDSKSTTFCRNTMLTSPERSVKRPDQKSQDQFFNNHFSFKNPNKSLSPISDDSLEKPLQKIMVNDSQLNEFNLTPLQSTENLISIFSAKKKLNLFNDKSSFDVTDGSLVSISSNSSSFKLENEVNTEKNKHPTKISTNLGNQLIKTPENELFVNFESSINSDSFSEFPKNVQPPHSSPICYHNVPTHQCQSKKYKEILIFILQLSNNVIM